jgi:hypothetical protein
MKPVIRAGKNRYRDENFGGGYGNDNNGNYGRQVRGKAEIGKEPIQPANVNEQERQNRAGNQSAGNKKREYARRIDARSASIRTNITRTNKAEIIEPRYHFDIFGL